MLGRKATPRPVESDASLKNKVGNWEYRQSPGIPVPAHNQ